MTPAKAFRGLVSNVVIFGGWKIRLLEERTRCPVAAAGSRAVVLVKPQFELDKSALNKKGIVTSERDREKAVAAVRGYASDNGFTIEGFAVSPVFYEDKNVEYLLLLRKPD